MQVKNSVNTYMIIIFNTIKKFPYDILGSSFRKNRNKLEYFRQLLKLSKCVQIPVSSYRELLTSHEDRFSEVNVKEFFQSSHLNSRLRLQN